MHSRQFLAPKLFYSNTFSQCIFFSGILEMLTQCSRSLFSASHLCSRKSFVLKRQYGRDSTAYCISSRTWEIFKPRGPCVFYCFLFVIVLRLCQLSLISLPAFVCDNRSTTCAGPLRRAVLLLHSAWVAFTRLPSPAPALVYCDTSSVLACAHPRELVCLVTRPLPHLATAVPVASV